jgi:hypothetical protein
MSKSKKSMSGSSKRMSKTRESITKRLTIALVCHLVSKYRAPLAAKRVVECHLVSKYRAPLVAKQVVECHLVSKYKVPLAAKRVVECHLVLKYRVPLATNSNVSKLNDNSNVNVYKGRTNKKVKRFGNWNNSWKNREDNVHCVS